MLHPSSVMALKERGSDYCLFCMYRCSDSSNKRSSDIRPNPSNHMNNCTIVCCDGDGNTSFSP
ncbi:hypothetical protein EXN66_Car021000 [Channa argus]|uniref:Uncharacterized protein n=1 Tax=Channa argus TaxID=215402 RepID=A0A6G1QSL1_CHAAH|nr:hypothetical protein EXN66_Car021000 [Channa argus]